MLNGNQFSLRSLLLFTLLAAIVSWFLANVIAEIPPRLLLTFAVHAIIPLAPIAGAWVGTVVARLTGAPTHYLGPLGLLIGSGVSVLSFAAAFGP